MLKTSRFPVIYLKRIFLFAFTILLVIQETLCFCLIYAVPSFDESGHSLNYSDEAFLSDDLTVISLNLLSDNSSDRLEYINEFISEYAPDVLGIQDADCFTLSSDLPYDSSDRYIDKGALDVNTLPILYRTDRFEPLYHKTAHGIHRYKDGTEYSLVSWIVLREKVSQTSILVINTKFTEEYSFSNARECVEVADKVYREIGSIPTILLGDMGIAQNDLAFRVLLATFSDTASASDQIYSSYNDKFTVGSHTKSENYPTDHIMLSKNDWKVSRYCIVRNELTLKMSDHYPVMVTLESTADPSDKYKYGDLKITGAFKRSVKNALFEAIEIVNTSSFPVDLYDYRLFYCRANSKEELLSLKSEDVTKNMRISLLRGKYILKPDQTAIVWLISSAHYTYHIPLITQGKDGQAIYQTEVWKALYEDALDISIPDDCLIVPLDRTSASYFRNGKITDLKNNFYLDKGKHEMLYLCRDSSLSVADVLSSFYLLNDVSETTASHESTSAPPIYQETSSPNESKPEGTNKPKETKPLPDHTSAPEKDKPTKPPSTEPLAPSTDGYTLADVSGIQKLPKRDGAMSLATLLVILSSALVAVCFISIAVLYIRYERKYNKK